VKYNEWRRTKERGISRNERFVFMSKITKKKDEIKTITNDEKWQQGRRWAGFSDLTPMI